MDGEPVKSAARRLAEQVAIGVVTTVVLVVLGWMFAPVRNAIEPMAYAIGLHDNMYPERGITGRWAPLPAGRCEEAVHIEVDQRTVTMSSPDGAGGEYATSGPLGAMDGDRWINVFEGEGALQLKRTENELLIRQPQDAATISEYRRCD